MAVKQHVEVAYKVVSFLAGAFWCCAIAPLFPCKHGFADVDAAVINDIGAHNIVAASSKDAAKAAAEEDVAHMPEVEGLVCVR